MIQSKNSGEYTYFRGIYLFCESQPPRPERRKFTLIRCRESNCRVLDKNLPITCPIKSIYEYYAPLQMEKSECTVKGQEYSEYSEFKGQESNAEYIFNIQRTWAILERQGFN